MKKLMTTLCAAAGLFSVSHAQTALDFDGVNDHITIANESNFDFTMGMTVEFWVNTTNLELVDGLVTKGDDSWRVHGDGNGSIMFAANGAFGDFAAVTPVDDGVWHHVAVTYDGTFARIFIDGSEENNVGATNPIDNGIFPVALGENLQATGRYFEGQLDNVRIWNVARSAGQIANEMDCEVNAGSSGLVAAYHFNDGIEDGTNTANTELFDNSGNGNHGTLQSFALTGTTSNFVASNRTDYMSIQSAIGSSSINDRMYASEPADFNGDGFDDLLVTKETMDREIYFNDGLGHFEAATPISNTINGSYSFAVGDIDNDGDIDLLNYGGTNFKVYVNDGAGNFTDQTPISLTGTGNISFARIGDVNGDNLADVILGNSGMTATDLNEIWINSGSVGNPAFTYFEGLNSSYAPINGIAIGDIDNDGDVDLTFGGSSWNSVTFKNDNNTTFVQDQQLGAYNGGVRYLDWNQDGYLDLMTNDNYNNWGVQVYYNNGMGAFLTTPEIVVPGGGNDVAQVSYADMNGDGFTDIVARTWGGNGKIFLNNGCTGSVSTDCKYKLGPADNTAVTGDFNGDGAPDVFCAARDRKSSASLNFLTPVTTPALSDITSTTGDEVCDGDPISIEATASNTGTIQWFSNPDGSTQIGTGSPYSPTPGPGAYEYYVGSENPNGCRSLLDTVEVIVNENPNVAVNASSVTALDCFGDTDGELNVDVTLNGTATSSTYQWDDVSNSTTQNLVGVGAGTYSIVVTDDNGCTATTSGTITEPTELTATATAVDVSCNGGTDGSVDLTANGGTGSYTFQWDDAANSTTEDLSAVGAGTYTVVVTDANGCTATASVTVTEPNALTATAQVSDVSCNGGTDGSVDLTVNGGTGSYTFQWDDVSNSTTEDLSAVGAGTYTVNVTDANGCTTTATATVTEPNVLTATTTATDVSCNGGTDGSVDLTVNGGTSSYSFQWDDVSNSTTEDLSAVGAGTYTVVVTDANGCTTTATATVTEPNALVATTQSTDVSCNGATDGSVDLTVNGGTGSYTYQWDDAANSTTEDLSAIGAGTYTVSVTDANGCITTATATVSEPDALVATAQVSDVSCNGDTDGSIDLSVTGGTTSYTFQWDDAANSTTEDLSALGAGTYTVDVTDANGCTTTTTVTVGEPDALAATATTTDELNGSDGSIDLSTTGGTSPYTYDWTGPNGFTSTDEDPTGLEGGTYEVTVTDDNGCTFVLEVIVDSQVGLEEVDQVSFNIYPNPSNGTFTIDTPQSGTMNILTTTGKIVHTTTISGGKTKLQLSDLTFGVYMIQLTTESGFQVKRLVIE